MICGISHLMVARLILAIQVRVYILSCLGSTDHVIVRRRFRVTRYPIELEFEYWEQVLQQIGKILFSPSPNPDESKGESIARSKTNSDNDIVTTWRV
jgi:hypothetical protein